MKITRGMIWNGFEKGLVKIVDSEHGDGAVCQIGDYWFYFGGETAEQETAESYLKNVPLEDIVSEVCAVLDDFSKHDEFEYEYGYYAAYLKEHGC